MTAPDTASIIEPRWTKPAWATPGGEFVAVLAAPACQPSPCWLRGEGTRIRLDTPPLRASAQPAQAVPGHIHVRCLVPSGVRPGLYHFEVGTEAHADRTLNAVRIIERSLTRFCFAHVTDLHFGQHLVDPGDLTYLQACQRLVAMLNEHQPLFVVITGDVVSRYGDDKRPLTTERIEEAARQTHATLSKLCLPLVLTAGNHDVAFPASRSAWEEHVGRPQALGSDDFSFEIGAAHVIVLEAFVHIDPATGRVDRRSFTQQQLEWLQRDIRSAHGTIRFLCTHFDYTDQLVPELETLGIDMLLYGHSKQPKSTPAMAASSARNGHLRENQCRFVTVDGDRFTCELLDWWEATGYTPRPRE